MNEWGKLSSKYKIIDVMYLFVIKVSNIVEATGHRGTRKCQLSMLCNFFPGIIRGRYVLFRSVSHRVKMLGLVQIGLGQS